jgi:hypothetical protein
LRLREFQTLVDIAREKTLIVVTPVGDPGTGSIAAMTAAFQRELLEKEAAIGGTAVGATALKKTSDKGK